MVSVKARPEPFASNAEWEAAGFPVPSANSDYRVARVRVVGPLTLWIEHQDGVKGHVRFEESALTGIFAALKDARAFGQVRVEYGAVAWPNGLDLAPDNMHRHLAAFGEWILQ